VLHDCLGIFVKSNFTLMYATTTFNFQIFEVRYIGVFECRQINKICGFVCEFGCLIQLFGDQVAAQSKAWALSARTCWALLGSNLAYGTDVCPCLCCVVLRRYRPRDELIPHPKSLTVCRKLIRKPIMEARAHRQDVGPHNHRWWWWWWWYSCSDAASPNYDHHLLF
jgi:hypothetical protein